ncbi:unnamed protein product [Rhizophagus irregularis]|nr:unnamed protein product [Rhizophagus irregularis]
MAFCNDELIIAIIKGSPNLRHLEIGHNDIGDEVTEAIAHTSHKLEYLDLSEACKGISRNVLEKLDRSIKIEWPDSESSGSEPETESPCEKQDIKHVGVCGKKITQNKESKMSSDIPQFTPKPHNIDDKNEALIRSECYTMRKCFTN